MPNNVKSCKKVDENTQTAKFIIFPLWNQLRGAKNKENNEISANLKRELLKIFTYYTPSRGYHLKAYVPRIPKMWYFLDLAVFEVELLAAEVG